jgi:AraC-like DNA-binding protein
VLKAHAEDLLRRLKATQTTSGIVEHLLVTGLPEGRCDIESVAKRLGVSRQTLYRRLKAESTVFQELLDGVRRDLAARYFRDPELTVNDVALMLGFSESSAFHRAFRRWFGVGPKTYRQRQQGRA